MVIYYLFEDWLNTNLASLSGQAQQASGRSHLHSWDWESHTCSSGCPAGRRNPCWPAQTLSSAKGPSWQRKPAVCWGHPHRWFPFDRVLRPPWVYRLLASLEHHWGESDNMNEFVQNKPFKTFALVSSWENSILGDRIRVGISIIHTWGFPLH